MAVRAVKKHSVKESDSLNIILKLSLAFIVVLVLGVVFYDLNKEISLAFFVASGLIVVTTLFLYFFSDHEKPNPKRTLGSVFVVLGLLLLVTGVTLFFRNDVVGGLLNTLGGAYSLALGVYSVKRQSH